MAQRWMQAKLQLAKRNGMARSGHGRPIGPCWDDVIIRRGQYDGEDRGCKPITGRKPEVVRLAPEDRPITWGQGRKARRLAQRQVMDDETLSPGSRIRIEKR